MQLIVPDKFRATAYGIYATVGVILGSIQVGFAAAEAGQPVWLTVALAVFAYIGGAIGYTALTHTGKTPDAVVVESEVIPPYTEG